MANEQSNSMTAEQQQSAVESAVMDSSDFFDQLESNVNGMVGEGDQPTEAQNKPTEATHVNRGTEQGNPQTESHGSNINVWEQEDNPYKKRYRDSSREAIKMNQQFRELKPFIPVLDAMKRDSGLVQHVRDYLQQGGNPSKNVQQKLNLSEDFEYDQQEAIKNPDSDSAKVLNAQVETVVNKRVNDILTKEKQNSHKMRAGLIKKKQEAEFRNKYKMSDDQFEDFKKSASQRKLTYDDVYYLLNKDQTNKNVANATKEDMLKQMKSVQNMPTSASDSNSQGRPEASQDDSVFDIMAGIDEADDLFG